MDVHRARGLVMLQVVSEFPQPLDVVLDATAVPDSITLDLALPSIAGPAEDAANVPMSMTVIKNSTAAGLAPQGPAAQKAAESLTGKELSSDSLDLRPS